MVEWSEYKLDDVYDFSSGLSKGREEFGFGFGFLTYKDVFNNYFLPDALTGLVNSSEKERKTCSIKRGDAFLTRTSETEEELGISSVALKDYPDATFNGFTKRLRPKGVIEVFPEYAGYYFRSPRFRAVVSKMASITTRASLNNEMLSALSIVVPPVREQQAIAEVLSSLDDKIDLLHRQNKALESLAETLFRQWFVEDAEESWEEKSLAQVANYLNGLTLQKYATARADSLPVIKIRELNHGITGSTDRCSREVPQQYIIQDGDILFSWSGSLQVVIWHDGEGALNQHLFKVTSEKYPKWFYYLATKHHLESFRAIAESKSTTMGHIQRHHLTEAVISIPSKELFDRYDVRISPLVEKLIRNNSQIQTLTKQRDSLLPRLMSGEARVTF